MGSLDTFLTLQDLDEGDPGVLEPFQKMLQFALEPLLLYVDPIAEQPGTVVPLSPLLSSMCVFRQLMRLSNRCNVETSQSEVYNRQERLGQVCASRQTVMAM